MLVPHWSGRGVPGRPPLHTDTCTSASHPQPMLTELAPRTMRLSLPLLLLLGTWAIPGGLGDRAQLTATAPQLDDEEKYSAHVPAHLRCDACRAVAYQVSPSPVPSRFRLQSSYPSPHPYRLRLNGTFQKPICFRHLLISFLICHIRTQYINPNQQIASDREPS